MIVLVTGGSGSGKSAFAESLSVKLHGDKKFPMLYIATMFPFDEEAFKKIERHKRLRKTKNFDAIECFTHLEKIETEIKTTALLECMSNLVANEMYQEDGAKENTVDAVLKGLLTLESKVENLVIVSNEIFSDGIDYDDESTRYQEYLGTINAGIAKKADLVVEIVYGIPIVHKGQLPEGISTCYKNERILSEGKKEQC
ncbi:Adenosylcobinamide-phosphate guanylyltransferase [Lachnospiraceae bacterium TWA4]|nr:Adenosylcobinamide-phosphate guanylyltransferase [Lachnospiraceae bacterium TWA4]